MLLAPYVEMIHGPAFPANPIERQLFYRDDLHAWFQWNGAFWVNLHSPAIIIHDIAGPWHTSGATPGQILQANLNGLPIDATNTDVQVAIAVLLAHARQHPITDPLDHTSGATLGRILQANINGLPIDATNTDAQVALAVLLAHARQHNVIDPLDHISGATPGQILQANLNGLPIDATNTDVQVAAAVAIAHARQHNIIDPLDHTSLATPGQILQANANGLPIDASNTDAQVAGAVIHVGIQAVGVHGSTVLATPNRLVHRDAAGRSQIVNPTIAAEIDNMGSRDLAIAIHAALTTGTHGVGAYGFTNITLAAVTLYVDIATGNDGNPGTSALPKQTILGALNALPVDIAHPAIICVRPGNYPENNVALEFSRFATLDYITIKVVNSNDEDMFDNGLATGGGNNFLDDAGAGWSINQFTLGGSAYIWIYEGTGAGQVRQIASNTATRITTTVNWAVNPDATSYYAIGGGATLTGTDGYHMLIDGKRVNIHGFKHTGATNTDIRYLNNAFGTSHYHYCPSSVAHLVVSAMCMVTTYYNYVVVTGTGFNTAYIAYLYCGANVIVGANIGLRSNLGSIVYTFWAGLKNYFDTCTTGILITSDSGCVFASLQVFNLCGVNINPAVSTVVPTWWT